LQSAGEDDDRQRFGVGIRSLARPEIDLNNQAYHLLTQGRFASSMKRNLMISIAICSSWAVLLLAAGIYAGTTVDDIVKMQNPAYDEHTKAIVQFNHKAHAEKFDGQYPGIFKDGCGECHHDDEGERCRDLEMGEEVENCIECHDKPGQMPKKVKRELRDQDLDREERRVREREYHAEALHDKCRGCHRKARKQADTRKPPITCSKCHVKDKS
jgi:hypothetical protein